MKDVAIVGIGQTRWSKYPDRSVEDLGKEAISLAVKDANINWNDIQYVLSGIDPYSGYQWLLAGSTLVNAMGTINVPATSLYNACGTGAYTLDLGRSLILSGRCDIVLCVASFKAPGGFFPSLGDPEDPTNYDAQRFRLIGQTNPSFMAYQAVRRMHNFGMTEADVAQVKVKSSKLAKLNPYARYQREYTIEEVMNSPMVCYPLRLYELAATSDGAAAVILCSMKKAKQLETRHIRIVATHGPQPLYPNLDLTALATHSEISTKAIPADRERKHECQVAKAALEQAGIGPEDIDFTELYDLSAAQEFDWMEDIGLCKVGEGEKLLKEGATTVGGRIPVNTSGGVSGSGEAIPAQALSQVCEIVRQLRGDCGPRQVENAKVGFAINKGLGNNVSGIVITK